MDCWTDFIQSKLAYTEACTQISAVRAEKTSHVLAVARWDGSVEGGCPAVCRLGMYPVSASIKCFSEHICCLILLC